MTPLLSATLLALPLLVLSIRCYTESNWDPSNSTLKLQSNGALVDCANYSFIDPRPDADLYCVKIVAGKKVKKTCDIEFWNPSQPLEMFQCSAPGHETVQFKGRKVEKYCCNDKDGCNASSGSFILLPFVGILALLTALINF